MNYCHENSCSIPDFNQTHQSHISRSLIQLTAQLAIGNVELHQAVTRWQCHFTNLRWIPRCHDNATIFRLVLDTLNDILQLINALSSVVVLACLVLSAKVSPLKSIDRTEITNFTCLKSSCVEKFTCAVAVPNANVLLLQQLGIGRAANEPQQFLGDTTPKDTFRRQQWKTFTQIKSHLSPEDAHSANASAIASFCTFVDDLLDQLEILQLIVIVVRLFTVDFGVTIQLWTFLQ